MHETIVPQTVNTDDLSPVAARPRDRHATVSLTPLSPPRRLLLGAGPGMVDARVYQAMTQPVVSHVDPFFFQLTDSVHAMLAAVFGTGNQFTMAISGTGTAAMEAAISNFAEPDTPVALLVSGYFAERMSEIAGRQGARLFRLEGAWGEPFDEQRAREFILRTQPKVVAYVQAETSTGVFQPGRAICEAAHAVGALVVADCVTSLGTMPVAVDETGIDIAFSCSQKGLCCPPGLAPITLSGRALGVLRARSTPLRSFYLDLQLLDQYYAGGHRYHHTASATLFYALHEGLAAIAEEGIERRWRRHIENHEALVAGLESLGLRMLVAPGSRLSTIHTPLVPEGIDDAVLRTRLRDRHGIEIMGGLGPLAGKVLRIGLMGAGSTRANVLRLLECLEEALRAGGFEPSGSGELAAERHYART
jgi:alanine-glyoxylate transaminase/serine-glyoxylate transaminase/serine-pyruvate transaminase